MIRSTSRPSASESTFRQSLPRILRRLVLAALFFFHPAANSVVGKAYFSIAGLNNVFGAVTSNIFLQPAILLSMILLMVVPAAQRFSLKRWSSGVSIGLGLWFAGAVLAFLWNARADLVAMTFCAVFLSGLFVFVALVDYPLEETDVDVVFIALALGSLFPLVSGLQAFYNTWGFPSLSTVLAAHNSAKGIQVYEEATFSSRGNTASLLVLIAPPLMALVFDRGRSWWSRALYGLCTGLIVVNLVILQQRAVIFICLVSVAFLWRFKTRSASSYLIYAATAALALYAVTVYAPDVSTLIDDRFVPAVTWDAEDRSVSGRTEAIQEGIDIAVRNLPFGLGPGSAVIVHSQNSAHQFNVQQGLEDGVLGFIGSVVLSLAALAMLIKSMSAGERSPENRRRFIFIVGPACYLVHGVLANTTINLGYVNTWMVLLVAMLALALSTEPAPTRKRTQIAAKLGFRPRTVSVDASVAFPVQRP